MTKRKSLYAEIDQILENAIKDARTNGHYKPGVFKEPVDYVLYALKNTLGHIRAIKDLRDLDKPKQS